MMSCQDSGPALCHNSAKHEEVSIVGDGDAEGVLEMFGDGSSTGDLFELVCQGGGDSNMGQVHHCLPLSLESPSEEEMAAWLYPIVRGEVEPITSLDQLACGDIVDSTAKDDQLLVVSSNAGLKIEVKCTENTGRDSNARSKPATGGRRSHHSETHNLTEKRRRWKINEKFRTLQQLVPGCDKGNQAFILDLTIQYMKSLQQQIQAMAIGCSMRAAAYPVVLPPYTAPAPVTARLLPQPQAAIAPGMLVGGVFPPGGVLAAPMTPFVPMLPLVRHPAVVLQYPENVVVPNVASPPARNQG